MKIYQSADGSWIFFDGATKRRYATEQEAYIYMAKQDTAKAIVSAVQALKPDNVSDLRKEYSDVAGAGWTDADVAALGITSAQLLSFVVLLENFEKFMTNQAPIQGDYTAVFNQARRVQA